MFYNVLNNFKSGYIVLQRCIDPQVMPIQNCINCSRHIHYPQLGPCLVVIVTLSSTRPLSSRDRHIVLN